MKPVAGAFLSLALAPAVLAAAETPSPQPGAAWEYSLAAATAYLPEAELDDGGKTTARSHHLRAGAARPAGKSTKLGLALAYDWHGRDFSGDQGFAALKPWDHLQKLRLTGSLTRKTRFGWSYGLRPFIGWTSETGNLESDAMHYGAALAVLAGLSADHRFGLGASVTHDIDDSVDITPIIIVDWRIDENWSIGNPRETNFTVPAGLELAYRPGDKWRFALAGLYQSSELRLDDQGVAPGGIGESTGILSFLRITRRWSRDFVVNAYVGALFNGELSVEDSDGRKLADSDYDTTLLAAVSFEGDF